MGEASWLVMMHGGVYRKEVGGNGKWWMGKKEMTKGRGGGAR